MLSMAWQFKHHPHTLRSQSKPGRAKSCTISGAIHETATISPVKTKSITIKLPKLLFQHDKRERRFTPTGLRGRVVEFKEAPNRDESKVKRESDGMRPLERRVEEGGSHGGNLPLLLVAHLGRRVNGGNLPANGTYLSHNALLFIPNSLQTPPNGQMPIYANSYSQSNASMTYSQPSSYSFLTQGGNPSLEGASILGLHEEQRISDFVHGLKTRSLVEFLSMNLPTTYKGRMGKTYTWIEAKEVATSGSPCDYKEG
nr:hypothetical protein [Tanacetum cinerariifolium]